MDEKNIEKKKSIKYVLVFDILFLFIMLVSGILIIYDIVSLVMTDEVIYIILQMFLLGYVIVGITEYIFMRLIGKMSVLGIINIGFSILDLITIGLLYSNSDVDTLVLFIIVILFFGIIVILFTLTSRSLIFYKYYLKPILNKSSEKIVKDEDKNEDKDEDKGDETIVDTDEIF